MPSQLQLINFKNMISEYDPRLSDSRSIPFLKNILDFIELLEKNFEEDGECAFFGENAVDIITGHVMKIIRRIDITKFQISPSNFQPALLAIVTLSLKYNYGYDHDYGENISRELHEFFKGTHCPYDKSQVLHFEMLILQHLDFYIPKVLDEEIVPEDEEETLTSPRKDDFKNASLEKETVTPPAKKAEFKSSSATVKELTPSQLAYLDRMRQLAIAMKQSFSKYVHLKADYITQAIDELSKRTFDSVQEMANFKVLKGKSLLEILNLTIPIEDQKLQQELNSKLQEIEQQYSLTYTPACRAKADKVLSVIEALRKSKKTFESVTELLNYDVAPGVNLTKALKIKVPDAQITLENEIINLLEDKLKVASDLVAIDQSFTKWHKEQAEYIVTAIHNIKATSDVFKSLDDVLDYSVEDFYSLRVALYIEPRLEKEIEAQFKDLKRKAAHMQRHDTSFTKHHASLSNMVDSAIMRVRNYAANSKRSFESFSKIKRLKVDGEYSIDEIFKLESVLEKRIVDYLNTLREEAVEARVTDDSFTQWKSSRANKIDDAIDRVEKHAKYSGKCFTSLAEVLECNVAGEESITDILMVEPPALENTLNDIINRLCMEARQAVLRDTSYTKWMRKRGEQILETIKQMRLDLIESKVLLNSAEAVFNYKVDTSSPTLFQLFHLTATPLEQKISNYLQLQENKANYSKVSDTTLTKIYQRKAEIILKAINNLKQSSVQFKSLDEVKHYKVGNDLSLHDALNLKVSYLLENSFIEYLENIKKQSIQEKVGDKSLTKWQITRAIHMEAAINNVQQSPLAFDSMMMLRNYRKLPYKSISEVLIMPKPALEDQLTEHLKKAETTAQLYMRQSGVLNPALRDISLAIKRALTNIKKCSTGFASLEQMNNYTYGNQPSLNEALNMVKVGEDKEDSGFSKVIPMDLS